MDKENKEILLKYLCEMLPYGVICRYDTVVPLLGEVLNNGELQEIRNRGKYFIVNGATCLYDDIKPYLRPMSSMTKDEAAMIYNLKAEESFDELFDYYNERHLDYRGLIPKGLGLEAPSDMYKIE